MQECPSNNKMPLYVSLCVFLFDIYKDFKNVSKTLFCMLPCYNLHLRQYNLFGRKSRVWLYLTSFECPNAALHLTMLQLSSDISMNSITSAWVLLLEEQTPFHIPESHSLWLAGVTDFCSFAHSKYQAWKVTYLIQLKTRKQDLFFKPPRRDVHPAQTC